MSASVSRHEVAQQPPAPGLDFTGFPVVPGSPVDMFRAHLPAFGPWFFSSHDQARFNLDLPDGTCYFADEFETAVREYFGPKVKRNLLDEEDAIDIRVTTIQPPQHVEYGQIGAKGVSRWSITDELTSMGDYTVTRAWASALHSHVDGLQYRSRFNPGCDSWALFGTGGPTSSFSITTGSEVDGLDAVRRAGIGILPPPPPKRSLSLVSGP